MLALHNHKSLLVSKENFEEFERLSSESEKDFLKFLELRGLLSDEEDDSQD